MNVAIKSKTAILLASAFAVGGALFALEHITGLATPRLISQAHAAEEGGCSGCSGGSGGSGGSEGGHDSGGGGHDSGGGESGGEAKGHGTKYKHQGHGGGQHGAASSHEAGGDRFGGGSELRGNNQVPEGIGRYGEGFSELSPTDEGRFRYWGGFVLPEAPPTNPIDPTISSTTDFIPGPGGGPSMNVRSTLDASPRCEGVASNMPAAQQFSGGNLLRLNAARGLVDPALAASGKIVSPYLMGSLQNELVKGSPNTDLAGTYLGLVAKTPVTADTVKKIGFQLCARMSDSQAKEIARVAEEQRAALAKAKADEETKNANPQ